MTLKFEAALSRSDLHALAEVVHPLADVGACSQQFLTDARYADCAVGTFGKSLYGYQPMSEHKGAV
jgi:hypothetical protein